MMCFQTIYGHLKWFERKRGKIKTNTMKNAMRIDSFNRVYVADADVHFSPSTTV